MRKQWTKEQALAICDRRGSLLLSAAAGSGKTAVLVERVLRMMTRKKDPVSVDRLMIATFTNEAAKELRRRIDMGLRERLQSDSGNEWLRRQQILLQKADISTISAFCGKLVREHFQQLELPSDFRIADDSELAQIKDTVIDDVMEEQYQNEPAFPELIEFLCGKDDEPLETIIFRIYEYIRSLPFAFRWLDQRLAAYVDPKPLLQTDWGQTVAAYCNETLDYAETLFQTALAAMEADDALLKAYGEGYLATVQMITDLRRILANGDWDTFYFAVRDFKPVKVTAPRGYKDDPLKIKVSEMRDLAKKKINGLTQKMAGRTVDFADDLQVLYPIMKTLFDTVKLYHKRFSEAKREKSLVDFSDLEHFTLQLLVNETSDGYQRTPLAEEIASEYDYLLIDEYQDTNEVQDLIFRCLSKDENNLFMVGDVKQSIYRFRQAMPEIFLQKRDEFARYDRKHYPATLILGKNFRSRQTVTDVVNFLFDQLMSREIGEIDYNTDEQLVAGASFPNTDALTELHILDRQGEKYPEKDKVYEAEYVAERVCQMLDEGYLVREGDGMRRCRPGDFCILLRSQKGKSTLFADALNKRGILTWADTEGAFLQSREVSVLISLLQAIDNPLADVPLLAVMLSPIFSFTPDDVAEIRLAQPNGALYMAVTACAEAGNDGCRRLLDKLNEYRRLSAVLQVNRLIDYLVDDTDFAEILQVMPDAAVRRANIRLFTDYAKRYSQAGTLGLSGFLRFVGRFLEKNAEMKSASKSPDGEDAVRIMSIHGSKGLEFPICIVADCGKPFNMKDLHTNGFNSRLGYSMKIRKPGEYKRYTNLPFEAIKLENERLLKSEEMRVLYVALTRAKEKLIMVMSTNHLQRNLQSLIPNLGAAVKLPYYAVRNAKSYGEWILMAALRSPDAERLWKIVGDQREFTVSCNSGLLLSISQPTLDTASQSKQTRQFTAEPDDTLYERLQEQAEYLYPFAEEAILPSKLSVTQITSRGGKQRVSLSTPRFLQSEQMSGAERGTAVHTFLQFADFVRCRENLQAEVDRMVAMQFITPQQGAVLPHDKLTAFLGSSICKQIVESDQAYREHKFMYELPAAELYDHIAGDEAILVQGIADCVVEESDGLIIVDYKTDRVTAPQELINRYRPQLELYRRALSAQFGKPVKRCVIYSVELCAEIDL